MEVGVVMWHPPGVCLCWGCEERGVRWGSRLAQPEVVEVTVHERPEPVRVDLCHEVSAPALPLFMTDAPPPLRRPAPGASLVGLPVRVVARTVCFTVTVVRQRAFWLTLVILVAALFVLGQVTPISELLGLSSLPHEVVVSALAGLVTCASVGDARTSPPSA